MISPIEHALIRLRLDVATLADMPLGWRWETRHDLAAGAVALADIHARTTLAASFLAHSRPKCPPYVTARYRALGIVDWTATAEQWATYALT